MLRYAHLNLDASFVRLYREIIASVSCANEKLAKMLSILFSGAPGQQRGKKCSRWKRLVGERRRVRILRVRKRRSGTGKGRKSMIKFIVLRRRYVDEECNRCGGGRRQADREKAVSPCVGWNFK